MITPSGFIRPAIDEIRDQIRDAFRARFTQVVDGITYSPALEPESFLGILTEILAEIKDDLYNTTEDSYYSNFLTTAEGVQLDRLAMPTERKAAIKAVGQVKFTGDVGTTIPVGTIVETEDKRQYETTAAGTIPISGNITLPVRALIAGLAGNAPENSLTFMPIPLSGIISVTNEQPIASGEDIESDASLRARAIDDRRLGITSTLTSVVNRVRNLQGVGSAQGFENLTMDYYDDLPPGAIEIVVRGGDDVEIAETIYKYRPAGIASHGTTSVIITDSQGNAHTEKFSRVTDVEIWVKANLICNSLYVPSVHDAIVKELILKYIGGVTPSSIVYRGLNIAASVYAWKAKAMLFDINNPDLIPGLIDATIKVANVPSPITSDQVIIGRREEAFTKFANITITVSYV